MTRVLVFVKTNEKKPRPPVNSMYYIRTHCLLIDIHIKSHTVSNIRHSRPLSVGHVKNHRIEKLPTNIIDTMSRKVTHTCVRM